MKRKAISMVMVLALVICSLVVPKLNVNAAGRWMQDSSEWWYLEEDGTYPVSAWKEIDGYWYYFNSEGYVVSGWNYINGNWYYFDDYSVMTTGWQKVGRNWYYLNSDGTLHTGWLESGGNWYYMNSDGTMAVDWIWDGSGWYLMDTTGKWINNNKIIYLTFDDGPGPYTDRLLGILDKYNVKATFFVTAAYPSYSYCISKAYNSGHTVAVHTYCHNYSTIYASEDAYWSDFEKMETVIENQTGSRTNLFRFPGGSSNKVSSFNSGVMTRLTKQASQKGYTYFDCNVSSGDAGETTSSVVVYNNIINGVRCNNSSVVLCHDIKSYTVDAMESFIPWALNNGYTFLPLTDNSPTAHHSLNN